MESGTTPPADTRRDRSGATGHAPHHTQQPRALSHVHGWGADLDPANRPGTPKERTPPRLEGVHWSAPEDQPLNIEVYHSTERAGVTPVFGTSTPPSGLSGRIRAAAYRLSENDIRHWLMLLFADRVNVVEGLLQDFGRGHIPNVPGEMGLRAEWRHNPAGLARKAAVVAAVAGIGWYLLSRRRPRLE